MRDALRSINTDLKERVENLSGQELDRCYLCGKCTAGCPVAPYQDIAPHVVMRMAQWGAEEVLKSRMIWLCAGCKTCATRCPNGLDTAKVCEALTKVAKEKGIVADRAAAALRQKFVDIIKRRGRMHELSLAVSMKIISGDILEDLDIGIPMFLKGKFPLKGKQIKDLNNFKKLFNKDGGARK